MLGDGLNFQKLIDLTHQSCQMLSFAERPASQNGLPTFLSSYQQAYRRK